MVLESVVLVIVAFAIGYILGKRIGRISGVREGRSIMPLILREQSYENGRCIVCNSCIQEERIGGLEKQKPPHTGGII